MGCLESTYSQRGLNMTWWSAWSTNEESDSDEIAIIAVKIELAHNKQENINVARDTMENSYRGTSYDGDWQPYPGRKQSEVHQGRTIRANEWEQAHLDETRDHERFVSVFKRDNIPPMQKILKL